MNEPTDKDIAKLKQTLEHVTASDGDIASLEPVDSGAASLREAWLAFGQLLSAADSALPEGAWDQRATVGWDQRAQASAGPPRERPQEMVGQQSLGLFGPTLRSKYRIWLALLATAAAVLIAMAIGWQIAGKNTRPENPGSSIADNNAARNPGAQSPKQDAPKAAFAAATKSPQSGDWDDPLDTQIASVSQTIRDVEQNWRRRTDDLDLIQYRIDKASDSMQDDPL